MSWADVQRLRETFGEDAERYDRARPGYPDGLFADLAELAGVGPGCRVLEIGCGTGKATVPLARLGCAVVGVELSPTMAAVARRNLAGFPAVTVHTAAFEQWRPADERFDLVLAATAFHWVDPQVRALRAAEALRPGGAIAVVSTDHVAGGSCDFFAEAQACYERFDPATPPGLRLEPAARIPEEDWGLARSGRFGPVRIRSYEWELTYTTDQYLDVLLTYSGHRALPQPARDGLLGCIADLIDRRHGGRITKRYLTRLAFATTPA